MRQKSKACHPTSSIVLPVVHARESGTIVCGTPLTTVCGVASNTCSLLGGRKVRRERYIHGINAVKLADAIVRVNTADAANPDC